MGKPHLGAPLVPATTANTEDGARSDIAADGFWGGRFERTFFDVRVFNPYAPSNQTPTPSSCYRKHENIKKREYYLRIREIERASFTPIVLSSTGGMGSIATTTCKRLASLLADKWGTSYSQTMRWLRAVYPSLFYDHPYNVSEERDQIKDMLYTSQPLLN